MAASSVDDLVKNYITTNHFYVEINGSIVACFSECSGLSIQIKKDVYFEGGVNDQQRITLGRAEFTDITLKRGMTDDLTFWEWLSDIFDEQKKPYKRRNINLLTFNQAGEIMRSWTLIGAIPVSWKTPTLQADGNAVAIEELTLAIEGMKLGKKGQSGGGAQESARDQLGFFSVSEWRSNS